MSKKIRIDTNKYPLIVITPTEEPSSEDVNFFTKELEEILKTREGEFIVISDNSYDINLPVDVRVNLGKSLNYISSKYSRRELAAFVVLKTVFGRMMFRCISLVAKNNLIVTGSLEEAEIKARSIIENLKAENI